jgi:hypothetical protein
MLVAGEFTAAWVYVVGPIAGGVLAALLYDRFISAPSVPVRRRGRPSKAPPLDPAGHVRCPIAAVRKPLRLPEGWGPGRRSARDRRPPAHIAHRKGGDAVSSELPVNLLYWALAAAPIVVLLVLLVGLH